MCGTDAILFNSDNLAWWLVSVILMMTTSLINVPVIRKGVAAMYVTKTGMSLRGLPTDLQPQFPGTNTENFYILRTLGAGTYGRVWLGCTESEFQCAIKVFRQRDQEFHDEAQLEVEVWESVWKKKAFKVMLDSCPAIIMPIVQLAPR